MDSCLDLPLNNYTLPLDLSNNISDKEFKYIVKKCMNNLHILNKPINKNGMLLRFIPKEYLSSFDGYKLCYEAVHQNGLSLQYVPDYFKDGPCGYKLCYEAIQQNEQAIQYVPKHLLVEEYGYILCMMAVSKNGMTIQHISDILSTNVFSYNISMEAVNNNGYALQYIPKCTLDGISGKNICLNAYRQNIHALQFILNCTYETYLNAIQYHDYGLYIVPEVHRTLKMCQYILKYNISEIEYIPKEVLNQIGYKSYKKLVKQDGMLLKYVPHKIMNGKRGWSICKIAVLQNLDALEFVTDKFKKPLSSDISYILRKK